MDTLYGNDDADELFGDAGADHLFGGDGDDTLAGGTGNDYLRGDAGSDLFVFAPGDGYDTIAGFESGLDQIDLTAFGAGIGVTLDTGTGSGPIVMIDGIAIALLQFSSLTELPAADLILA